MDEQHNQPQQKAPKVKERKGKTARVPNVFRNPLLATQFTEWVRDRLEEWEKAEAAAGRAERSRRKVQLIRAGVAEVERQADQKLGDQLEDF